MQEVKTVQYPIEVDKKDYEQNMPLAVLAYFAFFVPLVLSCRSKYATYHTNQGLLLFLSVVVILALTFIPKVGVVFFLLGNVYLLAMIIIGVRNAANGIAAPLPVIGKITIIKSY